MPEYDYKCTNCTNEQSQVRSMSQMHHLDEIDPDFICLECGQVNVMQRIVSRSIQVIDPNKIRLNGDPRKEVEYEKKVKDPDRARQLRKKKFGTEGVSITKSEFYKKEKKIKAKGDSQVDKKEFIQAAARNPNAVKAAQDALKKAGKKE